MGAENKLTGIGPDFDVNSSPDLLLPSDPFTFTNGRLLSVADGCGISKTANARIVGGTPAKNGKIRSN